MPKARFIYHITCIALTDEAPSLRSGMKHSPLRAEYEASRCAGKVMLYSRLRFASAKTEKTMKPVKASLHVFGRLTRRACKRQKRFMLCGVAAKRFMCRRHASSTTFPRSALTDEALLRSAPQYEAPSLRSGMKHSSLRAEYEASRCAGKVMLYSRLRFASAKAEKTMKPVKASLHVFLRLTRRRRASPAA